MQLSPYQSWWSKDVSLKFCSIYSAAIFLSLILQVMQCKIHQLNIPYAAHINPAYRNKRKNTNF